MFVVLDFLMIIFVYSLSGLNLFKDLNKAYDKQEARNTQKTSIMLTDYNGWRYILVSDYPVLLVMVYKTLRGI